MIDGKKLTPIHPGEILLEGLLATACGLFGVPPAWVRWPL